MGLFKKPKAQKQESGNHAWGAINDAFKPALGYVTQGGNMMANLLGVGPGGAAAQTGALDNWANSGGMKWQMEQGNRMINSNQAMKGLLQSGSTLKGLEKYGQGLGSTYLNQYMDQLGRLAGIGLGAGGTMAQAGQWSKGQGPTQGGAGKSLLPMIASAAITAASDPRLKENIVPVGNGLYEFEYRQDTPLNLPKGVFRGYMADELPEEFVVDIGHGYKGVKAPYLPKRISD